MIGEEMYLEFLIDRDVSIEAVLWLEFVGAIRRSSFLRPGWILAVPVFQASEQY